MTKTEHIVRASMLDTARTYHIGDDALNWQDDRTNGRIAFTEVAKIVLIDYPSIGGSQGQCVVRSRSGKKLKIRSHHYESLGSFEDRSLTYRHFVRELCRRVAVAAPDARFVTGSTVLWFVWLTLLVLCALVGSLVVWALVGEVSFPLGSVAAIAVLIAFGPIVWRMVREGPSQSFDPNDPPFERDTGAQSPDR